MIEPKTAKERVKVHGTKVLVDGEILINCCTQRVALIIGDRQISIIDTTVKMLCAIALAECNTCFGGTKVSDEDLRERPCPACTDQLYVMREKLGVKT